jgi:hypothetical protein
MPAVTVNTVKYNVAGSLRDQIYNISGNSGDFLQVGYTTVRKIDTNPGSVITNAVVSAGAVPGTSVITFTSSGAINSEQIEVIGN